MLSALLAGSERSGSVLVVDCLPAPAPALLRALAEALASSHAPAHVVCLERRPQHTRMQLAQDTAVWHDLSLDHRGWLDSADESRCSDLTRLEVGAGQLLVIDSVSALVSRLGFHRAYRQLHQLIGSGVAVLALLHEDCLAPAPEPALRRLRRLFATCVRVTAPNVPTEPAAANIVSACTRHVKRGGRVLRSTELVTVSADGSVAVRAVQSAPAKPAPAAVPAPATTFKMALAPREKAARDRLVLPYVSAGDGGGGGKVFYEPDDADDWDDEDPDEDLEI